MAPGAPRRTPGPPGTARAPPVPPPRPGRKNRRSSEWTIQQKLREFFAIPRCLVSVFSLFLVELIRFLGEAVVQDFIPNPGVGGRCPDSHRRPCPEALPGSSVSQPPAAAPALPAEGAGRRAGPDGSCAGRGGPGVLPAGRAAPCRPAGGDPPAPGPAGWPWRRRRMRAGCGWPDKIRKKNCWELWGWLCPGGSGGTVVSVCVQAGGSTQCAGGGWMF
ncbi:PREDICTED: translation initiation factor IF-2-like [Pseudopodoces humilis]|uniref:translation initiation factor IF-2-like n=1 Tax=Pseudopodoces humilis TaxID=181119 RepID=UPI0006B6C588|nr:PREDICTED: translation initiation factor IF-2-like [Pseudopodoces humilis]